MNLSSAPDSASASSKFGRAAMAVVCELFALDVVVTDTATPDTAVAALQGAGVEVHRV